jgi:hypothetical protein
MNFLSFGETIMLLTCAHDEAHNNIDNKNMLIRFTTNANYALTFLHVPAAPRTRAGSA